MKVGKNIEKKLDELSFKRLSMEYYRALELLYSNYISYRFREHIENENIKNYYNFEKEISKKVNQELKPVHDMFNYVKKSIFEYLDNPENFKDPVVFKYYVKSLVNQFEKTNSFFEKHVMPYLCQKLENRKANIVSYDKANKKIYFFYTNRYEEMNNLYKTMQMITEKLKKAIS
ncbi:MAG: hypothetical protein QW210_01160 [Candidatus Woesearchaeota archaeon]